MAENSDNSGEGKTSDADLMGKLDADLAETKKANMGRIDADAVDTGSGDAGADKKADDKSKKDEAGADDSDDDDDADDSDIDDDKDEDEEDDDESGDTEDDDDDEKGQKSRKSDQKRPTRFIPVKKYNEEKREYKKRIADLEALVESGTKSKDGKVSAKSIDAYAEKYGLERESVLEIMDIIKTDLMGEIDFDSIKKAQKIAEQREEIEVFEKEYKGLLPALKEKYPEATDAQLEKAKKRLDELGHSEWGHKYDLDYIFFKKQDDFDAIFKQTQKGTRTVETARGGDRNIQTLTAKSFVGKSDFSELKALATEERDAIVKAMDPQTFYDWAKWDEYNAQQGIEVRRGGEKVSLKS